jgi:hypothetical protein
MIYVQVEDEFVFRCVGFYLYRSNRLMEEYIYLYSALDTGSEPKLLF